MERNDLLKARADERERDFYSLRTVEWAVVFQSYAGFAVVAVVYHQMQSTFKPGWWLASTASTALSFLLLISVYVSLRIQERMRLDRAMQNRYYEALHKALGVERFDDSTNGPIHRGWYAFVAQLLVSIGIYAAIASYIVVTAPRSGIVLATTLLVLFLATGVGLWQGWLRIHEGRKYTPPTGSPPS